MFRGVQGVSAALMSAQTLALITALFAKPLHPRIFGIYGAVAGVAAMLGPVIGGVLISADIAGWGCARSSSSTYRSASSDVCWLPDVPRCATVCAADPTSSGLSCRVLDCSVCSTRSPSDASRGGHRSCGQCWPARQSC